MLNKTPEKDGIGFKMNNVNEFLCITTYLYGVTETRLTHLCVTDESNQAQQLWT